MPDLPALPPVTQAQADRILATFQNETDAQGAPLTPQAAYRRWSMRNLRDRVLQFEASKIDAEQEAEKHARLKTLETEMP